jgi:membrane-associated tyrosine/threonine-specific cdc2-inhibitory kinase
MSAPTPDKCLSIAGFELRNKKKRDTCPAAPTKSPAKSFLVDDGTPGVIGFENSFDESGSLSVKRWQPEANSSFEGSFFTEAFYDVSLVSKGDFGEVFRARSREDGRFYAIKRIFRQQRNTLDEAKLLDTLELQAIARLGEHRNLVSFKRVWIEQKRVFIQMELYQRSLEKYLDMRAENSDFLSESDMWQLILDIALGLSHIHAQKLVHLDLKPENIFLCDQSVMHIGDFGNAILEGSRCDFEGTNSYVAHETLAGQPSFAADIFSFGLVILEAALLMVLPRGGEQWYSLRHGQACQFFPQARYSQEMFNLFTKMTNENPAQRPTAAQILETTTLQQMLHEKNLADFARLGRIPLNQCETPSRIVSPSASLSRRRGSSPVPLSMNRVVHHPIPITSFGSWPPVEALCPPGEDLSPIEYEHRPNPVRASTSLKRSSSPRDSASTKRRLRAADHDTPLHHLQRVESLESVGEPRLDADLTFDLEFTDIDTSPAAPRRNLFQDSP